MKQLYLLCVFETVEVKNRGSEQGKQTRKAFACCGHRPLWESSKLIFPNAFATPGTTKPFWVVVFKNVEEGQRDVLVNKEEHSGSRQNDPQEPKLGRFLYRGSAPC